MANFQRAIFPGSFDPLTNGHVDIIERALGIFDELIVGVLNNVEKSYLFSIEERVQFVKETFSSSKKQPRVEQFSGLLVDFADQMDSRVIIRGLRAVSDFDYEAQLALMNRKLRGEIETFFLMTREECSYISSSLVKQVAPVGGDVSGLVPPIVSKALESVYRK